MKQATAENSQDWQTTRQLKVPVDVVYRAFTVSEAVGRWMCGNTYDTLAIDLDPRVGGVLHHRVRARADGEQWTFFGVYIEVQPGEKLRYTFDWKTDWREDPNPSEVEITFVGKGEETEIRLVHSSVPEAALPSTISHWTEFLGALEELLETGEVVQNPT
jgi:uncharacterized protein YndB with AHSA1/START domain